MGRPVPVVRTGVAAFAGVLGVVAALVMGTMTSVAASAPVTGQVSSQGSTAADPDHWVATWTSMPQLTEQSNMPPAPYTQGNQVMVDATLRQTVRVTVGGSRFRLHLNNVFGGAALPITAASVALPAGGRAGVSGIQAGTATAVTFGGRASVSIPVGAEAVSDPLDLAVPSGANLTVTLYLAQGQASSSITSHPGSRTTSYLVRGNHVTDATLTGATGVDHWYFLSGVDVLAPATAGTVVVLGDSLTDGRGSTTNGNDRWPDKLFDRLQQQPGTSQVAVANQAAGGNAVLSGGLGPPAVSRFDRDVLGQSGVRWLIVFEGVNDLGASGSTRTADDLIAAYQRFIAKARAAGISPIGATITPFGGNSYDDAAGTHEAARQRVNTWIRTSGAFDAVLDFDQVARDPANPRRLRSAYDTGDHLHLNPAGYAALAAAVPTALFTPSVPPATAPPTTVAPTTAAPTTAAPTLPDTSPDPGAGCQATYQVTNSWTGGFVVSVTVTVTAGGAGVSGWVVTMNLPTGTTVSNGWNAVFAGSSGQVTATNAAYNGSLAAGRSTSFGWQGTGNPADIRLSCRAS